MDEENKHNQTEYPKYLKCICLFIVGLSIVISSLLLTNTNHYTLLLKTLDIPFKKSNKTVNNISKINQINISSTFESRVSEYYPRLPIHIYTQDLSSIGNTSKLILLGNGFFGDRTWGIFRSGQSSTEQMNTLYCPFLYNRCEITIDKNRFAEADAIIYHMRDGIDRNLVKEKRHSKQRIVFTLWESPAHTENAAAYREFFNWTMTYRFDSHIITSYYSGNPFIHTSSEFYRLMVHENATKKLNFTTKKSDHRPSDEVLKKKTMGTAAAIVSNCGGSSGRLAFINKLKQYTDVKIYGRCGERCPPNRDCRQFVAENYYYILSFENSLCTQYATEKFFATLEHPVIPVVLGRTNYSYFIPSSGYINTNQFSTMKSLAEYLNKTRDDKEKYLSYFSWKKDYVWGLGHFFTPFCDLCVRLHLDSKPNIIDDIQKWWFDGTCEKANILP